MAVDINSQIHIVDINGQTQIVTIKQALLALSPFLPLFVQEWTGKSLIDYLKFKVGLQASQY